MSLKAVAFATRVNSWCRPLNVVEIVGKILENQVLPEFANRAFRGFDSAFETSPDPPAAR